jgi:hypothetical protein
MKRVFLLVAFASTVHAAQYRVCWTGGISPEVHCGEPFAKKAADAYVERANREFPANRYWAVAEARDSGWTRARWAGVGIALAAGVYDSHTTTQVLAAGGVERNPLFGSHPSAAALYSVNVGTVVVQSFVIEWWKRRHPDSSRTIDRAGFFGDVGFAALHTAAGLHNESVLERLKAVRAP